MQHNVSLCICAVTACTFCGRSLSGAAARRFRTLDELAKALRILRIQITSMLEPLQNALIQTDFPMFLLIAERLQDTFNAEEAWKQVRKNQCRQGQAADCLTESDLSILDRLFSQLGGSSRESQEEALRACIASIEDARTEAKDHSLQVSKLYTSIGFLAGLSAAILLL